MIIVLLEGEESWVRGEGHSLVCTPRGDELSNAALHFNFNKMKYTYQVYKVIKMPSLNS